MTHDSSNGLKFFRNYTRIGTLAFDLVGLSPVAEACLEIGQQVAVVNVDEAVGTYAVKFAKHAR